MWFVTLVLSNVRHRKTRSALTCLGMGVAVCAVMTMVGVADVFEQAVTKLFENRGVDLIVTRTAAAQRTTAVLPQDLGGRFKTLPGVQAVEPTLVDVVSFEDSNLAAVYLLGWDPAGQMFDELKIRNGRKILPDDRNAIILGSALAEALDKQVGQTVELAGHEFSVVGISTSRNIFENSSAVVALRDLQAFMDLDARVTAFMIFVEDSKDKPAIVSQLEKQITGLRDESGKGLGVTAKATEAHIQSSLELRVVKGMARATSAIALVIGVIGMLNTMMISVFERTREIGALRAIGWPKLRVAGMILFESFLLSAAGAVLGAVMSLVLTWTLRTFPSMSALLLPSRISLSILAQATALAIAAGLIGSLYPVYVASRLLPSEAVRHE